MKKQPDLKALRKTSRLHRRYQTRSYRSGEQRRSDPHRINGDIEKSGGGWKVNSNQKLSTGLPILDDALKDGCTIDEFTTIIGTLPKERGVNLGSKTMLMNFEDGTIKEVIALSDEQIRKIKHALGLSHDKKNREVAPNKIYRPKLKSYRNHYQVDQCNDWDDLVSKGFAKKKEALGMNFYLVTAEGIDHLKELGHQFERDLS